MTLLRISNDVEIVSGSGKLSSKRIEDEQIITGIITYVRTSS